MKVYKFSSDGEDQKCNGCGWHVYNLYSFGESVVVADKALSEGEALCGDCLCEVMADSGHTVQAPDAEPTHCVWLPDADVIKQKIGREPTEDEVVDVRHAFEKGIDGQIDWDMALDHAIDVAIKE
jgi:hypothetical protein